MNTAKRILCQRLLANHSVPDVVAVINRTISGEQVTYSQVETIRRGMVKNGEIKARPLIVDVAPPSLKPDAEPYVDPRKHARMSADQIGCQRLHDATIAYFKRRADEMGCDWAMAGAKILAGAV